MRSKDVADAADRANRNAQFYPKTNVCGSLPSIQVAGVQVFVYVDTTGRVNISAHWDEADLDAFPHWEPFVPVTVRGIDPEHVEVTR